MKKEEEFRFTLCCGHGPSGDVVLHSNDRAELLKEAIKIMASGYFCYLIDKVEKTQENLSLKEKTNR